MSDEEEFDAMASACIENHASVMQHGSPEMQMASQMLLYALAEETRRRERTVIPANDDEI